MIKRRLLDFSPSSFHHRCANPTIRNEKNATLTLAKANVTINTDKKETENNEVHKFLFITFHIFIFHSFKECCPKEEAV